jgi:hypothetical protein
MLAGMKCCALLTVVPRFVTLLVTLAACSTDSGGSGSPVDSGLADPSDVTSVADTPLPMELPVTPDVPDTTAADTGAADTGAADTGAADTGDTPPPPDAGPPECVQDGDCPASPYPCLVPSCDVSLGRCVYVSRPDDAVCDDLQPCTSGDACGAGQCIGTPVVCEPDETCVEGTCEPLEQGVVCPADASGSCFDEADAPGCDAPSCCQLICDDDEYCCEVAWDTLCVESAYELCPDAPPCPEDDCSCNPDACPPDCGWVAVEVRLRAFIQCSIVSAPPNPYPYYHGDGRGFQYDGGTSRIFQQVTLTADPESSSGFEGDLQNAYGSSAGYWWWQIDDVDDAFCPYAVSQDEEPADTDTEEVTDETLSIKVVPNPLGGSVTATFAAAGSNPVAIGAPSVDAVLEVTIEQTCGQAAQYRIKGSHDGYPAYELYLNQQLVYSHDPQVTDEGPLSLFPPMEHDVLVPSTPVPQ